MMAYAITSIIFLLTAAAAYITHLIWAIKLLASTVSPTAGQIVLAVLGGFIPPVGTVHGSMLWFGL